MSDDERAYRPTAVPLPAGVLVRRLGTASLPTELVARYRAVDREHVGSSGVDTPRHLDALEASVGAHGIRVPLTLAFNRHHGFLDGNHRLAVALRLRLAEVPVEVWTAPEDLRADYGRPLIDDDLVVILDGLGLAATSLERVRAAYSAASEQYIDLVTGGWQDHEDDTAMIRRHLVGLAGPVLDLGCGPGHWTAFLHAAGVDVTGVDVVPEFVAHARAAHPGPEFRLGSMTEVDAAEHSVAGILAWYSTIHLPRPELGRALAGFRRLLAPSGVLVIGFFDSDGEVAEFDHKVTTAYRWPVDVFAEHLAAAGFTEVQRTRHQVVERPDRRYAAIAARAS